MISKRVNDQRKYTNKYGAGAASVLRLCEASGIEGSNRAMIADSWFGGIRCVLGLYKFVLQDIIIIKNRISGYCKQ